jgi:RND superfamily putative drug exporter
VIIAPSAEAPEALRVVAADPGIDPSPANTGIRGQADGLVRIDATLRDEPDSDAATDTVVRLRASLDAVSTDVLVGGPTAVNYDLEQTNARDLRLVVPLVLLAVFVVLALLLRSLAAPAILIASVVLSFGAALGLSVMVFEAIGFAGVDLSLPLYAFVFLVALGVDYNIFLMTRVHEESKRIGTREGTLLALKVTGGVITAAGVVLAATFTVLAVLPLVPLAQVGITVALGVLLDAVLVRSLLVPGVAVTLGDRIWWPSALWRRARPSAGGATTPAAPVTTGAASTTGAPDPGAGTQ